MKNCLLLFVGLFWWSCGNKLTPESTFAPEPYEIVRVDGDYIFVKTRFSRVKLDSALALATAIAKHELAYYPEIVGAEYEEQLKIKIHTRYEMNFWHTPNSPFALPFEIYLLTRDPGGDATLEFQYDTSGLERGSGFSFIPLDKVKQFLE